MSWVKSLVRKAAAVTTGRVFSGSPPSAAALAATTASVAAGAGAGAGGAAAAGAGAGASASAAASAQPKAVASEELEQLRAENAKLKHAFHVIKVKIDKTGKASAVADGAGTPAASIGAQSNQEIRDIIARVMAQERQRVAAAAAAGRQHTGADDASGGADAAAAASADAALAASITASEAAPAAAAAAAASAAPAPAPAAPAMAASTLSASTTSLTGTMGATGAATVVASAPPAPAAAADAKDAFATAQAAKYGVASDAKSDTATPVAMYYGEDVYSSKEEAELQAGVKLLCYGNVGVTGGGKKVVARDPRFASAVFASDDLGSDEEEVIIVDLDETATTAAPAAGAEGADAHWWTVVDNPNPKESADDAAELAKQEAMDQFKEEPALHLEGPRGTAADGFALVEQEDMINAISDYSAQCVRRFAGAKQLDPQSLQRMLQSTFAQVEPPSTIGKLWQYGQLAYTGYGWASYAYYLYRTPAVWRGAYSVVKWALVLLV